MTDDVPDRVAAGLVGSWRRQASLVPEGVVYEVDGLVVALTNLPDDTLNVALVEQEPSEPADALGAVDRLFARHGQKLGVDLDQGRHPEVERAAAAMGLSVIETRMGMARSLEGFSPGPWPEGVRIRPMRDDSEVDGYVDVQIEAFGGAHAVTKARLGPDPAQAEGVRLLMAFLNGVPVAVARSLLQDGAIGIFGVATVRSARRQGIGTAVTEAAMDVWRGHADLAWLQADHEAEGVYARLGFEPVSRWQVWARPAPTWRLPAHSTYTAPHDGRDVPDGGHGAHAPVRGE